MSSRDNEAVVNPFQSPAVDFSDAATVPAGGATEANARRIFNALAQTKRPVYGLAILGFIITGMMILGAVYSLLSIGQLGVGLIGPLIYGSMAAVYLLGSLFLFRFGRRISKFQISAAEADLASAIEAQRSFWCYVAILTAAVFGIYFLFIVAAIGLTSVGWRGL